MIFHQLWNFWQDPPVFNIPGGNKKSFLKLTGEIFIDDSIIIDDRTVNMILQCRQGLQPVIEIPFQVTKGLNLINLPEFEVSGFCTLKCIFEGESLPSGWTPKNIPQIKFSFIVEKRLK